MSKNMYQNIWEISYKIIYLLSDFYLIILSFNIYILVFLNTKKIAVNSILISNYLNCNFTYKVNTITQTG